MTLDELRSTEALANARRTLLAARNASGHWEGRLSTSALSTATAVMALRLYAEAYEEGVAGAERSGAPVASTSRDAESGSDVPGHRSCVTQPQPPFDCERLQTLVTNGRRWLAEHQNEDGGWGDTVVSFSNISTTALVWAAFAGADDDFPETVAKAEVWLTEAAGDLSPRRLAKTIADRYGKDRTFSVPILTTLAITGRLGTGGWKLVPRLPFELAACPHQWFAALRLPVVSYALPALIAIGQVLHRHNPTWFLPWRWLRNALRKRTLRVLESIQPSSGGFLEATPLTSFVVLSLVGAGRAEHPVVANGLEFLVRSVREDGSWPIDTNLATWVTTLSVNGLAAADGGLDGIDVPAVSAWLLGQQYREEHPYTHAAPGGWAWTDLPGGVPDADDTPGALLALERLRTRFDDDEEKRTGTSTLRGTTVREAVADGVTWLLDLQNGDGGMPTFCRGWGALPFDRSSQDLTAHAIRAWLVWREELPELRSRIDRGLRRAFAYLERTRRPDGSWMPLWFGNQHATGDEENPTYGTSRVVLALVEAERRGVSGRPDFTSGVDWLLANVNEDGGWGGRVGTPSSIEETALALDALAAVASRDRFRTEAIEVAITSGVRWLCSATEEGTRFPPAPIGFYFAKLWYFEDLYPLVFTVAALSRIASLVRSESVIEPAVARVSS